MYILIAGCSNVGRTIASYFAETGHDVVVVDKDGEALKRLGSGFNGVAIQGTAIDEDILIKAGIKEADVFVAVTRDENINIMAAQIAKNIFGVKKVIARTLDPVKDEFYNNTLGIDTVCQTDLCFRYIKEFVKENGIKCLRDMGNGVKMVEFVINKFSNSKRKVAEINSEGKMMITAIVRNGKTFIPKGDFELNLHDTVAAVISDDYQKAVRSAFGLEGGEWE